MLRSSLLPSLLALGVLGALSRAAANQSFPAEIVDWEFPFNRELCLRVIQTRCSPGGNSPMTSSCSVKSNAAPPSDYFFVGHQKELILSGDLSEFDPDRSGTYSLRVKPDEDVMSFEVVLGDACFQPPGFLEKISSKVWSKYLHKGYLTFPFLRKSYHSDANAHH